MVPVMVVRRSFGASSVVALVSGRCVARNLDEADECVTVLRMLLSLPYRCRFWSELEGRRRLRASADTTSFERAALCFRCGFVRP